MGPWKSGSPRPRRRGRCSAPTGASICAGPTGASAGIPSRCARPPRPFARRGRARSPFPIGRTVTPITSLPATLLTEAVFNARLRRYEAGADPWATQWICYYFINDSVPPSFVVDVSDHYEKKRNALACHRTQFAPTAGEAVSTRLTSDLFQQLIESRDAQFGALAGVRFAEGWSCATRSCARISSDRIRR